MTLPRLCAPLWAKQLSVGMGVRMHEVLARPWVGAYVPLALSLYYFQCNQIKFTLFFISYCIA